MKETGTVVERKGDRIKVELPDRPTCHACSAGIFCRTRGEDRCIWVRGAPNVQIGDNVTLELSEGRSILISFLLFLAPLLLLALVYGILWVVLGSILWSIVAAFLSVGGYFIVLRGSRASAWLSARITRTS